MHSLAFLLQDQTNTNQVMGFMAAMLGFYAFFYLIQAAIFMVPAWFIAKKAGFSVPRTAIESGVKFIENCAMPDGHFRYRTFGLQASPNLGGTGVVADLAGLARTMAIASATAACTAASSRVGSGADGSGVENICVGCSSRGLSCR